MKDKNIRKQFRMIFHLVLPYFFVILFISCSVVMSLPQEKDISGQQHHSEDGFQNPGVESTQISFSEAIRFIWKDIKAVFRSDLKDTIFNNDGNLFGEMEKNFHLHGWGTVHCSFKWMAIIFSQIRYGAIDARRFLLLDQRGYSNRELILTSCLKSISF